VHQILSNRCSGLQLRCFCKELLFSNSLLAPDWLQHFAKNVFFAVTSGAAFNNPYLRAPLLPPQTTNSIHLRSIKVSPPHRNHPDQLKKTSSWQQKLVHPCASPRRHFRSPSIRPKHSAAIGVVSSKPSTITCSIC
jgi:hypothetical protein